MDSQHEIAKWVGSELIVPTEMALHKFVLLVQLLIDDSGSIQTAGNTQAVIDGHNGFLDALCGMQGNVLVRRLFLNNRTDPGFLPPANVPRLSLETFHPHAETPFFARSVETLQGGLEEAKRLVSEKNAVRTMTFFFTDGCDNKSGGVLASNAKTIIDVMLTTGTHIVGACAVNDGCTNFWQVFAAMGIPEHWIKVLKGGGRQISDSLTDMGTTVFGAGQSVHDFDVTSSTGFHPRRPDKR